MIVSGQLLKCNRKLIDNSSNGFGKWSDINPESIDELVLKLAKASLKIE